MTFGVGDGEVSSKDVFHTLDNVSFGCVATVEVTFIEGCWGGAQSWGAGLVLWPASGPALIVAVCSVSICVAAYGWEFVGCSW
jgi:hypothetical protein